ncbi:MAG: hypothetical protein AAF492_25080, partial [Verrucomicrobiota bacterium]
MLLGLLLAVGPHQDARGVEPVQTPVDLMKRILKLSEAGEYDGIRHYLVPVRIGEMKLEEMLIGAIEKNDERSSGDLAFSNKGLKSVIKKHGDAFKKDLNKFWKKEIGDLVPHAPELKGVPWEAYRVLEQGRINIVAVHLGKTYKLLFWENLNQLIKQKKARN